MTTKNDKNKKCSDFLTNIKTVDGRIKAVQHRIANTCVGSSTYRVFKKKSSNNAQSVGPKDTVVTFLKDNIDFKWFEKQAKQPSKLTESVIKEAKKLAKILTDELERTHTNKGNNFGYAAKIISLYIRDALMHTEFLNCETRLTLLPYAPLPVDSRIHKLCKYLEIECPRTLYLYNKKTWVRAQKKVKEFCDINNKTLSTKDRIYPVHLDLFWSEDS